MEGNAFSPTRNLSDPDGGAASHRLEEVRPDSAFSGTGPALPTGVKFANKVGTNSYVNMSESFFAIRAKITDNVGAALVAGVNDIALAQFAPSHMWKNVRTQLGGTIVEDITEPSQAGLVDSLANRSRAWLETYGAGTLAQAAFSDREELTTGLKTPEMLYFPPTAFWNSTKMIRAADLKIDMSTDPNWFTRVIESTLADKTHGAAGDYLIEIEEVRLYLSVYEPESDQPQASSDIVEIHEMRFQSRSVTAQTSSSTTFGLDSAAFKAFAFMQSNDQGILTRQPLSNTVNGSLTNITVDYAGVRQPQFQYSLDFPNAKTQRAWQDFLAASSADVDPSGASIDENTWRTRQPMFAWKLVTREGQRHDRLVLNTDHSAAFTGQIYVALISMKRLVLKYDSDGRMAAVRVALSDSDLISAMEGLGV